MSYRPRPSSSLIARRRRLIVRGMRAKLSSYDNATVGSGSIVNEVQFAYNDFGQLIADYQSHSGTVNTGSTPKVQSAIWPPV